LKKFHQSLISRLSVNQLRKYYQHRSYVMHFCKVIKPLQYRRQNRVQIIIVLYIFIDDVCCIFAFCIHKFYWKMHQRCKSTL